MGAPIGWKERIGNMIGIRDAIGVYGIYEATNMKRTRTMNPMLWHRYGLTSEGSEWLDYFGQDDGITDVGGYVTVSLSDSGILYLNSIREGVSSLSSSYDTTVATI